MEPGCKTTFQQSLKLKKQIELVDYYKVKQKISGQFRSTEGAARFAILR